MENKNVIENLGEDLLRSSAEVAMHLSKTPMLAPLGIAGAGAQALIGIGVIGVGKLVRKITKK